jgi:CheY-like chemotaxis protein
MANVVLVHWNEQEAKERARALKALGYKAKILFDPEKHSLAEIREHPPELFLIDLSRLPSQGREIAGHFRRAKATRKVPILFVGGDAERIKTARKVIPDAEFGIWEEIRAAIKRAIKNGPRNPVVPSTMASYSASALPKKLGIRANCSIMLSTHRIDLNESSIRCLRTQKLSTIPQTRMLPFCSRCRSMSWRAISLRSQMLCPRRQHCGSPGRRRLLE